MRFAGVISVNNRYFTVPIIPLRLVQS